jgi:hypothetical protein
MIDANGKLILIKTGYYLGIVADALWSVALLYPPVFGLLTGDPEFDPNIQVRLIMGMGGALMAGWTILLIWALLEPIQRRFVILITAYPVVLGMFVISLIGYITGSSVNLWLVGKTVVLMISMTISFILASRESALK